MSGNRGSYVVWRTYGAGFWSIIGTTLSHLKIAEEMGLVPVVDFANYPTIYNESHPVGDKSNMWEYYFDQPAGRSVEEIEPTAFVCDGKIPKRYRGDLTEPFFGEQWRSRVKIRTDIKRRIENNIEQMELSSRTLGVHLRGQEARRAKGHMFPATMHQFNEAIAFALDQGDFTSILLVSEAQQYIDFALRKWGDKIDIRISPTFRLRFRDSYRLRHSPRPNHRFELGFEALQDAYLLAQCGGIVRGHSGISDAASMLRSQPFEPFIQISQGRNSLRPYIAAWIWYAKATAPHSIGGFDRWRPS